MPYFLKFAIRPTLSDADQLELKRSLEDVVEISGEAKSITGDWIQWFVDVKDVVEGVGGVAGALSASIALGQALVKWRRSGGQDGSTRRTLLVQARGAQVLDLEKATDEEIISWFRDLGGR
jgi:hypothetical protein